MKRVVCVIVLGCSLAMAGCGQRQWEKPGMSLAETKAQEDGCWNYVLNDPEGRKKVKLERAFQVAMTGPLAFLNFDKDDPKTETANIAVFNGCMLNQGYKFNRVKS